ncbi:winged helix-turn-helix domain-containing protein [Paracoccus sp. DMF]|uniref:winged helix-turn-helix domain-containing protein n=1 Tax=Paracoccus sp. DMF TaxID=400837 RepID=UPI0021E37AD8|nr:response regulator transcription factor [Paracoccus sp. DMF]MCV2447754.1 response regulator transcription factor [Paracoccus sp. DMF]
MMPSPTGAPVQTPETEPPQRILFVEDDRKLSAFLCRYFAEQGYLVEAAHDGAAMRRALSDRGFDLVVLDVGLPGREDGYALARELKKERDIGILFLSARQEALDRIVGLEIGADDFLVKPFEPRELLARIRAILRRLPAAASPARDGAARQIGFDGWLLDLDARVLRDAQGRVQSLTTQEFNLLSVLAQRPGRVLSRDQLLDLTVSRNWAPYDRSVDVMIGKIRRKIGDVGPEPRRIRTIRGAGYMFSPEP